MSGTIFSRYIIWKIDNERYSVYLCFYYFVFYIHLSNSLAYKCDDFSKNGICVNEVYYLVVSFRF